MLSKKKGHFIQTTRKNSNSKWKDLLEKLEQYQIDINYVTDKFSRKLMKDRDNMKNNKKISECVIFAPRSGGSLNKRLKLAQNISMKIFPPKTYNKEGEKWSITQYSHLISELNKNFHQGERKQYDEEIELRKLKMSGRFCLLKNRPLSKQIMQPTAMPVTVAPINEIEPFLNFLSSNGEIIPNFEENKFSNNNCMKFKRGAVYDDGRMDMCKQVVGPNWIEQLMESLKNNNKIEHFLLGNNIINTTGALAIKSFLKSLHLPKIKTWYLAGNCIDSEGIKYICEGLEEDPDVKYIWLKRNPINPKGCKYISNMLKTNNNIKILDLHNCAIFDEGLGYLIDGINKNKSLRYLYLDANGITGEGILYLEKYFNNKSDKGITSLWIDMNRLFDDGCEKLLNSLKNYPYLKRLDIGSNALTSKICQQIYETFKDSEKLISLDIGTYKSTIDMGETFNKFDDDNEIDHMCNLIKENKSLKYLNINNSNISENGIKKIAEALENNNTLLFLNCSQYNYVMEQFITNKIKNKLKINLINSGYEITNNTLRYIKHSKNIRYIDSIYRNKM